jgi:hypothetical protein
MLAASTRSQYSREDATVSVIKVLLSSDLLSRNLDIREWPSVEF